MWLRGASLAEMDRARPELVAAARFALYAERVVPMLQRAEEVRSTPLPTGLPAADRSRIGRAKLAANDIVPVLRAVLHLEAERG